jgi:hypothetical protein
MTFSFTSTFANWDNPLQKTVANIKHSLKSISAPVSSAVTTLNIWEDRNSLETHIDLLDKIYTFQDYVEVSSFLKSYKFLIPILYEALGEIDNYFPNRLGLSLQVVNDLENHEEKLYLKINSLSPNSYDLLDDLDDNWWLDTIPKARFKMNIDLEY